MSAELAAVSTDAPPVTRRKVEDDAGAVASVAVVPTVPSPYATQFPSYTARYYSHYLVRDVKRPGNHLRLMLHSNMLCVLCVDPSNAMFNAGTEIVAVTHGSSKRGKKSRLEAAGSVQGKRKKNAMFCEKAMILATVVTKAASTPGTEVAAAVDGEAEPTTPTEDWKIPACIEGHALEMNPLLAEDPSLLRKRPLTDGFIALISPRLNTTFADFELIAERIAQDKLGNSIDVTVIADDLFISAGSGVIEFLVHDLPSPDYAMDGATLANNTWVASVRKISAVCDVRMLLKDFPFDKQDLTLTLRTNTPTIYEKIVPPAANADFTSGMRPMVEFDLLGSHVSHSTYAIEGTPFEFSQVSYTVLLERNPTYYHLKIISGIILLVVMNNLLFALDIGDSNRLTVSSTLFLAVVTYLFLVSNDVPKVAYSTRLDSFILFSMVLITMSYMIFCVNFFVERAATLAKDKAEHARKVAPEGVAPAQPGTRPWYERWRRIHRTLDFVSFFVLSGLYAVISPIILYSTVAT